MYFSQVAFKDQVNYYLQKRIDEYNSVEATQRKVREFNRENPIGNTETIVYQSESESTAIEIENEVDQISYNPAYYVLNYLNPNRTKKK